MSRRKQIHAIMDQTAAELISLGEKGRKTVFLALKQAEVEISAGLSRWLAGVTDGAQRFTTKRHRTLLLQIKEALKGLGELDPTMRESLSVTRTSAGAMAIKHVKTQYGSLSGVFGNPVPLNLNVAAALSKSNELLIRRHVSSALRYSEDAKTWIGRQLAVGLLRKESFDQMGTRLMKLQGVRGIDKILPPPTGPEAAGHIAKGLVTFPRHMADRLVRTEAINAYNTYHTDAIVEAGLQKRWDATLDRRGCVICRGLDGEIVGAGESFSEGMQHPPAHPFCRCTVVGWKEEWGTYK